MSIYDDDICSHGRPNHQDLIHELREAVGLFAGAMSITPKKAWAQAIAEVDGLRTRLAAAQAVIERVLVGWKPDMDRQLWERTPPPPPHIERRRFGDVPRGWHFRLNVDGPWQMLNTEASFMWDREAIVDCTASLSAAWDIMTDAEHDWFARVAADTPEETDG